MRSRTFGSSLEMGEYVATTILGALTGKGRLRLCVPTGNSPLEVYRALARAYDTMPERFLGLNLVKLDEWAGLPKDHPASCEHYIRQELLDPLEIPADRYLGFDPNTPDPQGECARMESLLREDGPFDLCILGLGINGHVGLIEPSDFLDPFCQVSELSKETRAHKMLQGLDPKPRFGMTLGMRQVLDSKKIILLVSGKGKETAYQELLKARVSPRLPISFLWLHPKVECLLSP